MRHGREQPRLNQGSRKIPQDLGHLFGLGWSLAIFMTGGVLFGRWIDGRFGWNPWGLLFGILLGMACSGFLFYRTIQKLDKKE